MSASQLMALPNDTLGYEQGELSITVLGGVRLEGLDRMRVTLKVEVRDREHDRYLVNPDLAALAIRHNLDLYNEVQVDKLIRKVAERLEVGSSVITKALSGLTDALEGYRMEQINRQQALNKPSVPAPLSEEGRRAAHVFLSEEDLLKRTGELLGASGIIGEETNRLLMYLIYTSRKREHPLHVVSLASSGTGKSYLQDKVGALVPAEDKIEITQLSEQAFYYFGQQELSHKLLLIEDLDGAAEVLYPLRELQSKRRITKTVVHKDVRGQTRTVHLRVDGPVCVSGCTTQESIYEDNSNRSFLLYLDESPGQDERVMDYQRAVSAGQIDYQAEKQSSELLLNCQRVLVPVKVINPYAEQLKIPIEVFKPRRTNAHYLAFIELITFYHQYQREQKTDEVTGEVYIETTLSDIAAANMLLKGVLLRKSDELNTACRRYLEMVKKYLQDENKTVFTLRDIRWALRINHSNQKRYMGMLLAGGYVKKAPGKNTEAPTYEIVNYQEYMQLEDRITGVLDEILTGLQAVHRENEPPTEKKTNGLSGKVQKVGKEKAGKGEKPAK